MYVCTLKNIYSSRCSHIAVQVGTQYGTQYGTGYALEYAGVYIQSQQ